MYYRYLSFKVDVLRMQRLNLSLQMDVVVCGSCKVSAFIIQLCSDLVHLHKVEKILYTSKLMVPASNSTLKPFLIMVSGKNFVDGMCS